MIVESSAHWLCRHIAKHESNNPNSNLVPRSPPGYPSRTRGSHFRNGYPHPPSSYQVMQNPHVPLGQAPPVQGSYGNNEYQHHGGYPSGSQHPGPPTPQLIRHPPHFYGNNEYRHHGGYPSGSQHPGPPTSQLIHHPPHFYGNDDHHEPGEIPPVESQSHSNQADSLGRSQSDLRSMSATPPSAEHPDWRQLGLPPENPTSVQDIWGNNGIYHIPAHDWSETQHPTALPWDDGNLPVGVTKLWPPMLDSEE